jgi:hypothetical protein
VDFGLMLIETTAEHVLHVAENMRAEDRAEIMASSGMQPLECLVMSVSLSQYARSIVAKGKVIAILGLSTVGEIGIPWLLGTTDVSSNKKVFFAQAKKALGEMKSMAPFMTNYVLAANKKSVAFIKKLGFTITESLPFGVSGKNFYKFELGESHV